MLQKTYKERGSDNNSDGDESSHARVLVTSTSNLRAHTSTTQPSSVCHLTFPYTCHKMPSKLHQRHSDGEDDGEDESDNGRQRQRQRTL